MAKKLQILRGTTAQNDAYTGSIGELTMDTEKVEVRIHDGTTQGGKTIGSGGANLPILTHVFSDHKLNDISWLNADTFSWQSGDVYVAAYEHLLEDYENRIGKGTESDGWLTETIDGILIYYVVAPDGHKICVSDNEANVQALYEKTGVAWYYILDKANKQFKLPRTKFGFTGLRDTVGGYVEAGLPNITGEAGYYLANVGSLGVNIATGAFAKAGSEKLPTATKTGTESTAVNTLFNFNASRSSSVYGNSNTVQPKATQMYLYFYVGNFEREAVEQTAGLNTELFNEKADVDLSSLTATGKEVCANMTMPSNRYVDLTIPVHGGTFTAPADGWFELRGYAGSGANVWLRNEANGLGQSAPTGSSGSLSYCLLPAKKGDIVQVGYYGGSLTMCRFVYANGTQ